MTNIEIASQKQEFIDLCHKHIHRDGLDSLLEYLDHTDFYTAPSSTRFHLNEEGGLCRHSINVFEMAVKIYEAGINQAIQEGRSPFKQPITMENIAIAALFHDLCKIGIYYKTEKFRKDAQGRWETYLAWEMRENYPVGHAEKSLFTIFKHIKSLEPGEVLAIRWHMGMFDVGESGSCSRRAFYDACEMSALVSIISSADFLSSKCLELTTEY